MPDATVSADSCAKSPTGKHDPVSPAGGSLGYSTSAAPGFNSGHWSVVCSWCGIAGAQSWHEVMRQVEGHGPYAKRVVRVNEKLYWYEQR